MLGGSHCDVLVGWYMKEKEGYGEIYKTERV